MWHLFNNTEFWQGMTVGMFLFWPFMFLLVYLWKRFESSAMIKLNRRLRDEQELREITEHELQEARRLISASARRNARAMARRSKRGENPLSDALDSFTDRRR